MPHSGKLLAALLDKGALLTEMSRLLKTAEDSDILEGDLLCWSHVDDASQSILADPARPKVGLEDEVSSGCTPLILGRLKPYCGELPESAPLLSSSMSRQNEEHSSTFSPSHELAAGTKLDCPDSSSCDAGRKPVHLMMELLPSVGVVERSEPVIQVGC